MLVTTIFTAWKKKHIENQYAVHTVNLNPRYKTRIYVFATLC